MRPEMERFFYLDDVDRRLIGKRRGDHSRLGFALQMCTVRYLGLFLEDPLDVPWPVVAYVAEHLGVENPSVAKRATDKEWLASRPRLAKASRTVQAVYRLWSEQLDLVAEAGADLDAAAMFVALETEVGPRAEVEAAARLLDELLPPGDDETEAEMRRQLAGRYKTVRPFLSLLGESSTLGRLPAGGGCWRR